MSHNSKDKEQLLEQFARLRSGALSPGEAVQFRVAVRRFPDLEENVREWEALQENLLVARSEWAPAMRRGLVMAALEQEREMEDQSNHFPVIHPGTTILDLNPWIGPGALRLDEPYDNMHVQFLHRHEEVDTMLVHVKGQVPEEVHSSLVEQFLVLQGECIAYLDDKAQALNAGSYFRIPAGVNHSVTVTSEQACVFLCQRIKL